VLFVVNGLIKGEIEKPSGQYLGLICDESLTCRCLNLNTGHFGSFTFILVLCGESCFLVSWCACSRCDMAGSDEDCGRSRRPSAEDCRWSSAGQVLGGRMIDRSVDTVSDMYHAHGDEERGFLGLASKPRSTISQFGPQNQQLWFGDLCLKINATVSWFGPQNQEGFGLSVASQK
jgi:hypothetical protein